MLLLVDKLIYMRCVYFMMTLCELQVMEKINNPHYLYRMTVLVAISLLAPVVGAEATCQTMLPVVINAAKDRCSPYLIELSYQILQ